MAYAWSNGGTSKKQENKYSWNEPLPSAQPKTKYKDEKLITVKKTVKPIELPTVRKPSYNRLEKIESQPVKTIPKIAVKPIVNATQPKKVVQQGKVPIKDLKRVDNPFAPLIVNAANTATFGLLERNNKSIQELQKKSPITSTIGSMAGYIAPGAAGTKLLKPLTSKIAKPLAKRVIEGAAVGGGIEAVSGAIGNRGLEQTKKNVGYGVALGGVADLGLYGIGKGISKIKSTPKTSEIQQLAFNKKFGKLPNLKPEKPVQVKLEPVKIETPNLKGKFTIKDTAKIKAQNEYNQAIETIQNHFMTNKLIPEEIARIKPELGIDLDKLTNNLNAKTDIRNIAQNNFMRKVAGVDTTDFKPLQKQLKTAASKVNAINTNTPKANKFKSNEPTREPKIVSSSKADKTTFKDKFNKLYTATVDKNKSIGDFSKLANDKTYTLATNSASQKNIADYIMTDNLVNKKGEAIGKSLKEVFKDIPQDKDNSFMNYALEKHNIARAREGKPIFPNRTSEQSAAKVAEIEKINPEWKAKSNEITKWISDFMDEWGVKAGTLDEGLSKANKKLYPDYIPTNRDFSTLEQAGQGFGGGNKGFVNQTTPIKRATGSSRDIIDPRENIANMVVRTVKAAKNNEVGQSLVNSIRTNPETLGKYAQIVAEPKGNVNNIVRVLENGKPTYVQINDLGLLKAMENLNKTEINGLEAASKKVTNVYKQLITQKNPVFAIRNIARDVPTAYVNGSEPNPFKFGKDLLKSGKDVVTNSKEFQQYKALGGGGANFFDSGNPSKSINELVGNVNPIKKALKSIPNGIDRFNSITESAPRFAEFKRVLAKTNDVDKALYAASDVTTNFSRGGDLIKKADSFVPYLNASFQGLDKTARQLVNKPVQTIAKGLTGITSVTAALNYLNKDNENYKNLDNRTKDNYFLIPDGDTFIKIPKSRENGVLFSSLMERVMRARKGEKEPFKGFGGTVATNFSPTNPFENNIFSPLASNIPKNKDFAGRAIVPQAMIQDGRSSKYQYDEKTTILAKKLGEAANLSPKQIDYIIKSYTGVIGQMGIPAMTPSLDEKQTTLQKALKPITQQFVADPLYSNSAVTDFYDNLDKLKRIAADSNISNNLPSELVTSEETQRNEFNKASLEISDINKLIKQSKNDEEIRMYKKRIIDIANRMNKMVE